MGNEVLGQPKLQKNDEYKIYKIFKHRTKTSPLAKSIVLQSICCVISTTSHPEVCPTSQAAQFQGGQENVAGTRLSGAMGVEKSSEPVKKVMDGLLNQMQPLKPSTSSGKAAKRGRGKGTEEKPNEEKKEKTEVGTSHFFPCNQQTLHLGQEEKLKAEVNKDIKGYPGWK